MTATAENPETAAIGNPGALFLFLWQTKYGPAIADQVRARSEHVSEAFLDGISLTVCGEELRMLTPRDLLMLDGFENRFVCAGLPSPEDRDALLWELNKENDGKRSFRNAWRREAFLRRMRKRERLIEFAQDYAEIHEYLDRMLLDTREAKTEGEVEETREQRPSPNHFLAGLFVAIAGEIGAFDPASGRPLAEVPIPRLIQYRDAMREEDPATEVDSQKQRCMDEVNAIMAERRKN